MSASRVRNKITRTLLKLELFEWVGILASLVAVWIFFAYAHRFDEVYGIEGFHWKIIDDVVGLYENWVPWVFMGALLLLLSIGTRLRRRTHPYVDPLRYLIRIMVAFIVLMAIYKVMMFYIDVLNPVDRDFAIQHIDQHLFFGKLVSEWLEPIIHRPLTWLLSAAYMSWFVLSYATILVMMTHSRRAMADYAFTAMFTFYIGYFTYLLVPVVGPVFTVSYAKAVGGIVPMFVHGQDLISRDCFPSLHTGITVVMMVQVWRYCRRWAWFYFPVGILIIFATLYLRFHYGLDVIAGACLAATTTQLAPMMLRSWDRLRMYAPVNQMAEEVDTGEAFGA